MAELAIRRKMEVYLVEERQGLAQTEQSCALKVFEYDAWWSMAVGIASNTHVYLAERARSTCVIAQVV
jgi:hypothetical protein